MAQLSESQLATIRDHPIGDALNSFRAAFESVHPRTSLRGGLDHYQLLVAQPARRTLVVRLIGTLQLLPAADVLTSDDGTDSLSSTLALLYFRLSSNQTDFKHTAQLVKHVVAGKDGPTIWAAVYDLIRQTQPTPPTITSTTSVPTTRPETPPPSAPSTIRSIKDTPWSFKTSGLVSTTETRTEVDPLLKFEVEENLIIDHPGVFDAYFGRVTQLSDIAAAVFDACRMASPLMYTDGVGWADWPPDCNQNEVLGFLHRHIDKFMSLAGDHGFRPSQRRRCVTAPDQPLDGSTARRKLDVGIARGEPEHEGFPCHWSHILVPGELKSNWREDNHNDTRLDISRYAREVFSAQDTRRFVLGFTLCGSLMRLWEFDRLGVVASKSFDINKEGYRFVSVILGYLWMNEEELGFDPTIMKDNRGRYMEIERNERVERIYIESMTRQRSIAGRATTCWKGYAKGKPGDELVIKDSWQYEDHPEEGLLLKEAAEPKVEDPAKPKVGNVARYYYHETVRIGDAMDDVRGNVRRGLDDAEGRNPLRQPRSTAPSAVTSAVTSSNSGLGRGRGGSSSRGGSRSRGRSKSRGGGVSRKRASSTVEESMPPPPPKRSCSDLTPEEDVPRRNRVHRRVIMRGVGKSLYRASSLQAMLTGLVGGIKGHESLFKAGILHRDISIGNVLLNEAEDDGFLIDLDLAIKIDRKKASGAPNRTGTKVFMAIGALYGEDHSFMHDLESFFWLLFWICTHWNGAGVDLSGSEYDSWNSKDTKELAELKSGKVLEEEEFENEVKQNFTEYCKPLVTCVQELRKVVFPGDRRRKNENETLYSQMMDVLEKARVSFSPDPISRRR
ncbi:hypothetical protein B0J12DRAFT_698622 [Macrophomina phaseolina]|uniref:non-specific serine/threonine protein kinase n=1 Tax=Macrophomina phaseolina TaxID=35725 RepID=A0ABQ8GEP1_9PEZI|nr:hypothetical protein B0J12DRAFT_698622 [Macrophomina phaseolina]